MTVQSYLRQSSSDISLDDEVLHFAGSEEMLLVF